MIGNPPETRLLQDVARPAKRVYTSCVRCWNELRLFIYRTTLRTSGIALLHVQRWRLYRAAQDESWPFVHRHFSPEIRLIDIDGKNDKVLSNSAKILN